MTADKYRPWELHRRITELGDNGLCVECESRWNEPIVAAPVRRQSRDTW